MSGTMGSRRSLYFRWLPRLAPHDWHARVLRTLLSILMMGAHRQLVRDSGLSPDSLRQMTSAMGSIRPSPHLASADEIDGARVPRIGRPPSFHFLFFYRWLPRLDRARLARALDRPAGHFTDAAFDLD
jgi:hypothetical protein